MAPPAPPSKPEPSASPRRLSLKEGAALGAILLIGLGLRIAYLSERMQRPDFDSPVVDALMYDYWAHALVSGDWTVPDGLSDPKIPSTPFAQAPGYPYFLALVYLVFGRSCFAIRVVQMALGLANCVLVFFLGRALFGRVAALLASAFMASYWALIYYEGELNSPTLAIFVILCLINVLRRWPEGIRFLRIGISGVLLGALTLVRPETLLQVPVIAGWGWWVWRGAARRRLAALMAFGCGVAAAIAPVTIRNYAVSHEFVLIAWGGGVNLYAGNNELANGTFPVVDLKKTLGIGQPYFDNATAQIALDALKKKLGREDLPYRFLSQYFGDLAFEYIVNHPMQTIYSVVRKSALSLGPTEVANVDFPQLEKDRSRVLRYLPGFPAVMALFLLGALLLAAEYRVRGARNASRSQVELEAELVPAADMKVVVLLLLFVAVHLGSFLPFFVAARFRVPVIPILLLIGAYGVCRWGRFIRQRDIRRFAVWGGATLVLFGVASVPLASYDYKQDIARWHIRSGIAYERKGQIDNAVGEYRQACAVEDPSFACFLLGSGLAAQGNHSEALQWLQKAVDKDPSSSLAQSALGSELYAQGKPGEAIPHLERAVQEDPQLERAYGRLGAALADVGEYDRAVACFKKQFAINPNDPYVEYNWGRTLALQGNAEEAIRKFQEVVRKSPRNAEAHNYLGFELAKAGRTAEAVKHYEEALRIVPGFTLAHNNLGNALVDLRRYDEAIRHFQAALGIDPQDPYAEYNWGRALALQGKSEEAIQHFEAAIRTNPTYAEAHNFLSIELAKIGRRQEAIEHHKEALRINPRLEQASQ